MIELNWKTVRFIAVGILGALVYFIGSYLFLTYTEIPAFLASLLTYGCSFGFAYLGQKVFAFRSIAPHSVTLARYAVLQACCATFVATFTQVFVSYTDLSPLIISGLATVFTSGISYVVSSCWVFSDSSEHSPVMEGSDNKPISLVMAGTGKLNCQKTALILAWMLVCVLYVFMYYYMPWQLYTRTIHDDRLFINLAYSLASGDWLGSFSQFTLMKGPGYAFFLAFTHFTGLSLFLLVGVFHSIAVSFFSWCVYRLSHSIKFSSLLFIVVLFVPLVISNGRVIRDQIYPDQFLLGLAALIFSLFIANTLAKRSLSAILSGLIFAWFWLTREEGVWVLPSVVLLIIFSLVHYWRKQCLKPLLLSSVLLVFLSFLSVQLAFQLINQQVYGRFVGVDIKEKNFKDALAGLQSVRDGGMISHVPVSRAAMQRIYDVSPSFLRLKPFINTLGTTGGWIDSSCALYSWTCGGEYAGGWFIWLLRDAVASLGYYRTPSEATDFFARLASEINLACDSGRLECEQSLLAHMPKILKQDIDSIPDAVGQLYKMMLISEMEPRNIGLYSSLKGDISDILAILNFLNSQDRFIFESMVMVTISGKYKVAVENKGKIDITITNKDGEAFKYSVQSNSSTPDSNQFYPFRIETACLSDCQLNVTVGGKQQLSVAIPNQDQVFKSDDPLLARDILVIFEKVEWKKSLNTVVVIEERLVYESRQVLLVFYQRLFPVLLTLGLISFFAMLGVYGKQRSFPVLFAVSGIVWLAILVRQILLLLVQISAFPAINMQYYMPIYSLLLIASLTSIYLFFAFLSRHFLGWGKYNTPTNSDKKLEKPYSNLGFCRKSR
jgi:putative flippase GtrA